MSVKPAHLTPLWYLRSYGSMPNRHHTNCYSHCTKMFDLGENSSLPYYMALVLSMESISISKEKLYSQVKAWNKRVVAYQEKVNADMAAQSRTSNKWGLQPQFEVRIDERGGSLSIEACFDNPEEESEE